MAPRFGLAGWHRVGRTHSKKPKLIFIGITLFIASVLVAQDLNLFTARDPRIRGGLQAGFPVSTVE